MRRRNQDPLQLRVYSLAIVLAVAVFAWFTKPTPSAAADNWRAKANPNESDLFFLRGEIPELRIEITEPELQKLRQENRKYVKATLTENGKHVYPDVGIKLKGAAGSFRGVDDRPALTINVDKFATKETQAPKKSFHAIDKFHLNNSVQDNSYLNERICSELFLAAGVPAARVTHARVWLNNRDLGLYVLKEGFDTTFLKRHFADPKGNLYDGGFLQEIDVKLEKDTGDGPDDHSDLAALVQACRNSKLEERWPQIAERLNVDQFLTFMALEILTCHWDGYCRNRNNYRLYFDPTTRQAHFLPHGMDQMFNDPGASIQDRGGALVPQTVLQNPDWYAAYRQRIRDLQPLLSADKLLKRVDEAAYRLKPVLMKMHPDRAREHADRVREMKARLTARANSIREQIRAEPVPLAFNAQGEASLADWSEKVETSGAKLEQQSPTGQPRLLVIDAAQLTNCVASWRTSVMLAPGRYKFQGRAKGFDIQATESSSGRGAGLRISGGQRTNQVVGSTDWTALEFPLDVDSLKKVELVAELRASKGRVAFDADSLKLVKVKSP